MKPICYQEIDIDAPAARVWEIIKDPMVLSWMPKVAGLEIQDGGAVRLVTIDTRGMPGYADVTMAPERCYNIDHERHSYNYTYDGPDLPISEHVATIEVQDVGKDRCKFVWSCVWTLTAPISEADERQMADGVEAMWRPGMEKAKIIAEAA